MTLIKGGGIRVYRGGVLKQRGYGFFSGLLNVMKKGAAAIAPSLLQAGKEIVAKSLPTIGKEVMNMVTGKQKIKSGLKNMLHRAVKPAVQTTVSDALKQLVPTIKDRKPPPKRSKPSGHRTVHIKKRKKDIFDHGFRNDAT